MLKKTQRRKTVRSLESFAIVASEYNARYVDAMVKAARLEFRRAGVRRILLVRVPGAFEIPVIAARLVSLPSRSFAAVVCLGVILRGETTHADHIGRAVTAALVELQIRHHVPVIHEVLLLENREQARVRCLDPRHNRGIEAARTAMAMARVMGDLGRHFTGLGVPPKGGQKSK